VNRRVSPTRAIASVSFTLILSLPLSRSRSFSLSLIYTAPGFRSASVGCAGRCVGVTLIVVALRRRAVVTLYSPFAQLRELKLLDRHCTPTIEVMSLVSWLLLSLLFAISYFLILFFFLFSFFFFNKKDGIPLDRDVCTRVRVHVNPQCVEKGKNEEHSYISVGQPRRFTINASHCLAAIKGRVQRIRSSTSRRPISAEDRCSISLNVEPRKFLNRTHTLFHHAFSRPSRESVQCAPI